MPNLNRPRWLLFGPLVVATLIASLFADLPGCSTKDIAKPLPAPPPPTYTGLPFLRGTIGSLAAVRGMEPMLVSGKGLVVGLPDTGSTSTPAFLRQWLLQEMRRRGVGSIQTRGILNATPEQILASGTAAVVAVEGFLPPGGVRGESFDVLVSAWPQTETTNLEGGRLWLTDLSIDGVEMETQFSRKLAAAGGPVYLDPFGPSDSASQIMHPERDRQGVILSGGVVTSSRRIELLLNQASGSRSRMIADRINERFHHEKATQIFDTAMPVNDQVIQINVPARFAARPEALMNLISHLYLQRGADFEQVKARELATLLASNPKIAPDVNLAWQTLGTIALPVIREHYDDKLMHVRLTALEAGACLGDELASQSLGTLAQSPDPALRARAAELLVHLPRSLHGADVLKKLLDDEDQSVRIAAYESVARIGDPALIQQSIIGGKDEFKFVLDLIPSSKPFIYISQGNAPRVAIFDLDLGFKTPTTAALWEHHLMVRTSAPGKPASVFYQPIGEADGKTYAIAPTLANLVFLLAHKTDKENPSDGLDLTYSQVVNAIYTLHKAGQIDAPLQIQINPLASAIARVRRAPAAGLRPETAAPSEAHPAATRPTQP